MIFNFITQKRKIYYAKWTKLSEVQVLYNNQGKYSNLNKDF